MHLSWRCPEAPCRDTVSPIVATITYAHQQHPGQMALGDEASERHASKPTPGRRPPQFLNSSWASTKEAVASAGKSAQETFEDIKFDPAVVFGETKNDVIDGYRKAWADAGLCTRCESFPSANARAAAAESVTWQTPLSRLLYHADWCQLCSFLLSMLCRPDNDPLRHAEVAAHLPGSLRGMSNGLTSPSDDTGSKSA
jgi:hypothetical protein